MKILLIAGHGNGDPGAVANGYKESELTREFVSLLKPILSNYAQVDIADTKKNWFEYLGSSWFNFKPYNYVLEVHFNAGGNDTKGNGATTGVEIYIPRSEKGYSVEENIVSNLAKLGLRNRHLNGKGEFEPKKKDFRVISKVKSQGVSSALLELCFIDDIDDMRIYTAKKNDLAKAVAKGIVDGFKLTPATLTEPADIIQKLSKSIEINDVKGAVAALTKAKTENSSLYWILYKVVNK